MNLHIACLIKACNNLGISYKSLHKSGNVIQVNNLPGAIFANHSVPFNSSVVSLICKDKDYTAQLLQDSINMPRHFSYLDPATKQIYNEYKEFINLEAIKQHIIQNFKFPLILKRNRGSVGSNVFKCQTEDQILNYLELIFQKNSIAYDYVAIAQDYVDPAIEYRVIIFDKQVQFIYQKDNSKSKFVGNVSPLHFDNARAVLLEDSDLINKVEKFIAPIYSKLDLQYCGLDIIQDHHENLWLIELNSTPGFNIFMRDNGQAQIVRLFEKMLSKLCKID